MNCPLVALPRQGQSYCYWHSGRVFFAIDGRPEQSFPLASESQCFVVDPLSPALAVSTPDEVAVHVSQSGGFDDLTPRWRLGIGLRVYAACFGAGWLACATDETIQVFDAATGSLMSALSLASTAKILRLFAFSPNLDAPGLLLAVADDSTVVVWETATWSRAGASSGRVSFARVIASDARLCQGAIIVALAFADGRVAVLTQGRMNAGTAPALLSFGALASLGSLAHDASSSAGVFEEGECAIGVEILHEARLSAGQSVTALLAFVTQRRVVIAGLSARGLRGLVSADLEELFGRPILARECCLCPPAADPSHTFHASERPSAVLVIGAVLGGKPLCARIEHVLEAATKTAHAVFESEPERADADPALDSGGIAPADAATLHCASASGSRGVEPSLLHDASMVSGYPLLGNDHACDGTAYDDFGDEDDGGESAPDAAIDDATSECVAERVPDATSFLVQARPPDLLALAGEGAVGVAALSFEAQRRAGSSAAGSAPQGAPVTFHARIKSSGYGAAPPRKPAWATKRAPPKRPGATPRSAEAAATAAGGDCGPLEARSSSYPSGRFPGALDDNAFPALAVSAAARGASVPGVSGGTQASRSLARSQAVVPCGPIASLAYRADGSALAVASHDGSVHVMQTRLTAGGRRIAVGGAAVERLVSALGGGVSPVLRVSWSHGSFPGLAQVMKQAAPPGGAPQQPASAVRARPAEPGVDGGGSPWASAGGAPSAHARAHSSTAPRRAGGSGSIDADAECPLLLTCGGSRSATMWAVGGGRPEPVLVISSSTGGGAADAPPLPTAAPQSGRAAPFPGTVSSASFFFCDKFALLSAGDAAYAFSFALDSAADAPDDVARLKRRTLAGSLTRYQRAAWWQAAPPGASVTQLAAHNSFRSSLVCAACSDRTLRIYDAGAGGGVVESWNSGGGGHTRALHSLALIPASPFAAPSRASLDCVLTAGHDGVVCLWDLRSRGCVRQLSGGHAHRSHACGLAASPDALFVAVGSEDRSASVYDLRSGGVVARLLCATDAATAVAWHPGAASIAVGSLDGGLRFFGE